MQRQLTGKTATRGRTLLRAAAMAFVMAASAHMPAGHAAPTSDIRMTKHNLSKNSGNAVRSMTGSGAEIPGSGKGTTDQVCVFCHTPHAASQSVAKAPLWNRDTNAASTYTGYTSLSMDADGGAFKVDTAKGRPAGPSMLCLSCHDGTIALGNVKVLDGRSPVSVDMAGTGGTNLMPAGSGSTTGFTRLIGTNLSNDHPISVTYNDTLATTDGELRRMNASQQHPTTGQVGSILGIRRPGYKPLLPLAPTGNGGAGQVQCTTCHDPHLYDAADPNRKFLRANRLQVGPPTGGAFNEANDTICLACHDKMGAEWANSAHAKNTVGNYAYTVAAATQRQFAAGTQVWQAACLNCHDTHTVTGARRLLREGTDSLNTPKAGGNSAIEETCYQCHASTGTSALTLPTMNASTGVPDIKTEFNRPYRMPIRTADQGGGTGTTEVHNIKDAHFTEDQATLGYGALGNRHAECTDCHNPHRVIKNSRYDGTGSASSRTHAVAGTAPNQGSDGNIASGALRGAWGVEPVYGAITTWPQVPPQGSFQIKKGVPGVDPNPLTKEYQLCFKCHSNYANSDLAANFPALGGPGGTTAGTNGMQRYTNVAAEFAVNATNPPSSGTDQGEVGGDAALTPSGSPSGQTQPADQTNNHRSWHPVTYPTGRNRAERRMGATGAINMRTPWDTNLGRQTMHCSDCHGYDLSYIQNSGPDYTKVQGPHGSTQPFLLKGSWDLNVKLPSPASTSLCGKCHNPGANGTASGFGGDHVPDDKMGGEACMYCHIAVPHGWKNKAFLVNLRCVGQEVSGTTGTCQDRGNGSYGSTTLAPYYNAARLRISTWAQSGGWGSSNCGGGTMEDSCPRTGG